MLVSIKTTKVSGHGKRINRNSECRVRKRGRQEKKVVFLHYILCLDIWKRTQLHFASLCVNVVKQEGEEEKNVNEKAERRSIDAGLH